MLFLIIASWCVFFSDYSITWVLYGGPHLSGWFLQYTAVFVDKRLISDVSLHMQSLWQWYSSQGDLFPVVLTTSTKDVMYLSLLTSPAASSPED